MKWSSGCPLLAPRRVGRPEAKLEIIVAPQYSAAAGSSDSGPFGGGRWAGG